MTQPSFILSREDWSLHRKGYQDQARHQQKVREAIKQNLPDLLSEENIILSDGRQIIKIPIRSLDEYRFIFNSNKKKHVGQGDGDSKVGDVLGTDPPPKSGKGEGAGDQPGDDVVEAEISIAELENMLFEELELPYLKRKEKEQIEVTEVRFTDVRRKGIISNIDKKRTILENLRRNARKGHPEIAGITPDDLRFKTWEEIIKPQNNAVILAMMDTSGSLGVP
jgi:sporulation protein YhbH